MMKLSLQTLATGLIFFFSTVAIADVFENDSTECFAISRVIDGKIYWIDRSTTPPKEQLLDLRKDNIRRDQILLAAQDAASKRQSLCGSVRGLSVKATETSNPSKVDRAKLVELCGNAKEDFQKQNGWTGFLSPKQMSEVEDVYAKCLATKGESLTSNESMQDKVTRYQACREATEKARADCNSSADPETCIKSFLSRQKESFKVDTDFVVLPGAAGRGIQCRIDGHAPSRRELSAPTRQAPVQHDKEATEGVR